MKLKPLWKVCIITTSEAEDAVAELLSAILGQPAVAYGDVETGASTVTVYLQTKPKPSRELRQEISTGLNRIKQCGLIVRPGRIVISKLRQEDWAESWKRHFKPIEISEALLIKPSWSKHKPREGQALVVLDPGLSFGTGQHPTTAFCLREIVRNRASERVGRNSPRLTLNPSASGRGVRRRTRGRVRSLSFLDIGTGSGILAIAAAKLGYSPVRALDFDAGAVGVARANARANRVHPKLKILYGDVTKLPVCPRRPGQGYDLVCANLTSDLLIAERRRIAAQLNAGGTLVLAGILKSEFGRVQEAYKGLGLELVSRRSEREWRSGSFRPIA